MPSSAPSRTARMTRSRPAESVHAEFTESIGRRATPSLAVFPLRPHRHQRCTEKYRTTTWVWERRDPHGDAKRLKTIIYSNN